MRYPARPPLAPSLDDMQPSPDAWSALRARPGRFLLSRWPWRSLAYLVTTLLVGIPLLVVLLCLTRLFGVLERRRLGLVQDRRPSGLTWGERRRARRRLPVSWPELGYAFLLAAVLWPLDFLLLIFLVSVPVVLLLAPALAETEDMAVLGWHVDPGPEAWLAALIGLVLAVVAAYAVTVAAVGMAGLARLLLEPREAELAAEVADLRRSRVDLVDAFETERRRIERDLHDGVQQRLVALTMTLGRAELDVPEGPGLDRGAGRPPPGRGGAGRAARHHPRHPSSGARRPRARGGRARAGRPGGRAGDRRHPAAGAAARRRSSRRRTSWSARRSPTSPATRRPAAPGCTPGGTRRRSCSLSRTTARGGATADGSGTGLAGLVVRLEALGGTLQVTSPPGGPTEVRMECPQPEDRARGGRRPASRGPGRDPRAVRPRGRRRGRGRRCAARLHRAAPAGPGRDRHPDAADAHRRGAACGRADPGRASRPSRSWCCRRTSPRPTSPSSWTRRPAAGIGYLLKDRVGHVREFLASLDRVAAGETVVDPRGGPAAARPPPERRPARVSHRPRA